MRKNNKNNGSILIVVLFAIALLTAFVTGMLEMNVEQIQLMKNEAFMAEATAIAEAGLADAFARLRTTPHFLGNFSENFGGGSYSVLVTGLLPDPNFTSTGTSPQGFTAKIEADVTVNTTSSYVIRIDKYRINE
jgi:Tfp pilus assembly protein PilX